MSSKLMARNAILAASLGLIAGSTEAATKMDLHSHSYCSDGLKTPESLVQQAKAIGLQYYALTDHETVACLPRALQEAKQAGIHLIPGIEVGAEDDSLHILGLGIDPQHSGFKDSGTKISGAHIERAKKMIARLEAAGMPIDFKQDMVLPRINAERKTDDLSPITAEQAQSMTEEEMLAQIRGHILLPDLARAMVAHGYVSSVPEAFGKYIGDEAPNSLKIPMNAPSFRDVINQIHSAGGVAILAHPFTAYKYKPFPRTIGGNQYATFEDLADDLIAAGLDGFEYYRAGNSAPGRTQSDADQTRIAAIVAKHQANGTELLLSPGSDYHGYDQGGLGPKNLGGMDFPDAEMAKFVKKLLPNLALPGSTGQKPDSEVSDHLKEKLGTPSVPFD